MQVLLHGQAALGCSEAGRGERCSTHLSAPPCRWQFAAVTRDAKQRRLLFLSDTCCFKGLCLPFCQSKQRLNTSGSPREVWTPSPIKQKPPTTRFSLGARLLLHIADRVILAIWRVPGDDNISEGLSGEVSAGVEAERPSPPC